MRASRAKVVGLQDTATTIGTADADERARLRLRTLAWRIEYDGVESFELNGFEGTAEEVALLRRDRLEPLRCCRGALQARDRIGVVVGRGDPDAFGKAQRERSDAAEQVRHRARALAMRRHQPRQRGFARRRRLQEGACRQRNPGAADTQCRRPLLRDDLAVAGEPREVAAFGDLREPQPWKRPSAALSRARRRRGRRRSP